MYINVRDQTKGMANRMTRERDAPTVDEGRVDDQLSPMDELERMDLQVELAGQDEERTMFDPDVAPKPPSSKTEGVTDVDGKQADLMTDTPAVEHEIGIDDVGVDIDL